MGLQHLRLFAVLYIQSPNYLVGEVKTNLLDLDISRTMTLPYDTILWMKYNEEKKFCKTYRMQLFYGNTVKLEI